MVRAKGVLASCALQLTYNPKTHIDCSTLLRVLLLVVIESLGRDRTCYRNLHGWNEVRPVTRGSVLRGKDSVSCASCDICLSGSEL